MKLYDCKIAPNPRRLRMFLAEKGISMEMIEVDILGGENLQPSYQAVSPRGLLPTLVLDDGTVIDEVMAICRYFEELQPDPPLLGTDPRSCALVISRQRHMEIDGMIAVSEIVRNSSANFASRGLPGVAVGVPAIAALVERGTASFSRCLAWLETYLSRNPFVAGDRFSLADITARCAIDFAGWANMGIPKSHMHTQRWYDAVSQRASAAV